MKLNKFILGFGGIMALTLTACHDDPTYEPAAPQVTPPAYFNMSDEQVIDLEEDSKDFIVPIYRAEGGAAQEITVTTSVRAEEGASADVFNIPQTVKFEEGLTRADIKVTFSMDDIVKLKHYYFDFKVEGESNPYLLTSVNYDVMYTPWQTITDNNTGSDISTLVQDGMLTKPFTMDVLVQEQPSKPGFFRVRHPYANMPQIQGGSQLYPESENLWLYINATNARGAFFSDSRGKTAEVFYRTGWSVDEWGEVLLVCAYSSYLNQKPLMLTADQGFEFEQFASYAGTYQDGIIDWKNNMCFTADPYLMQAGNMGSCDEWRIELANAEVPSEWESLGTALVQDGFLSNLFWEPTEAYTVAVERNVNNPNKIQLLNPYVRGVFPDPSPYSPDGDFNLVFDVSNPNCVILDVQDMGYTSPITREALRCCNEAALYYFGYLRDENKNVISKTMDEIIAEGINDTYVDNVITINHPMIINPKNEIFDLVNDDDPDKPADWKFIPEIINITPNQQPMVLKATDNKPKLNSGRIKINPSSPLMNRLNLHFRSR